MKIEPQQQELLKSLVQICISDHTPEELALGWLRYEAVRKMSPRQFGEVHKRNLSGEFFDDIVTEAVLGINAPGERPGQKARELKP